MLSIFKVLFARTSFLCFTRTNFQWDKGQRQYKGLRPHDDVVRWVVFEILSVNKPKRGRIGDDRLLWGQKYEAQWYKNLNT